jgi:hypothetical protein
VAVATWWDLHPSAVLWADELEMEERRETIRTAVAAAGSSLARVAAEIGIGQKKLQRFLRGGELLRVPDRNAVSAWCAEKSSRAPYVAAETLAILILSHWVDGIEKRIAFRSELRRTLREMYAAVGAKLPASNAAALEG